MNSEDKIKEIFEQLDNFSIKDVPNIDLYMDQVTTYLNNKFTVSKRYEDDKLLTKTMINNYAKSRLLPSPEKKKYSSDHIIVLVMIFFFKNVISINDVTKILTPLIDQHFHNDEEPLEDYLNRFLEQARKNDISKPILNAVNNSKKDYAKSTAKDKDYLETLELITMLSYDMFARKLIIEKLIDSLPEYTPANVEAEKKTKE